MNVGDAIGAFVAIAASASASFWSTSACKVAIAVSASDSFWSTSA